MNPPKRLARKTIYQSPWVNLHLDKVELPSGKIIEEYHTVDHTKEGVSVLVTNSKGEILMIEAWRYREDPPIDWEIPAGSIDKGEDPLEAGKREVLEETGYTVKNLKLIHSHQPSVGMSTLVVHTVFAELESENQAQFDTDEIKSVHWMSVDEVRKMISGGKITHGCSLVPLLLYLNQKKQTPLSPS